MVKVLVVDDEPACLESIELLLTLQGFEVLAVATGHEAIADVTRFCPDVAIIDWMLRDELDGLQVAGALIEAIPGLGIIIITGYPSDDVERRIRQYPGARYLAKPNRADELIKVVRELANC